MAVKVWGAFAAGIAAGWAGRSVMGSGRELVVRGVVTAHRLRGRLTRVAAEQVEWVEDMRASAPVDEEAPARVVRAHRGRAA